MQTKWDISEACAKRIAAALENDLSTNFGTFRAYEQLIEAMHAEKINSPRRNMAKLISRWRDMGMHKVGLFAATACADEAWRLRSTLNDIVRGQEALNQFMGELE